jgi:hypothetical protein
MARTTPHIDFLSELQKYPQVMEIITMHTYGRVWLVGGSVTTELDHCARNPSHRNSFDYWNLYSAGHCPYRDFDFIAEEIRGRIRIPREWSMQVNTFGGIKFKSKSITMDLWKLRKHEPCRRNNAPYTIENVINLAPLNVQAIAADLREGCLLGEPGIKSVESQTVSVNHMDEARHYCQIYGMTLEDLIRKKATEYSFIPMFPR